jgi:hypothetical protein
VELVLITYSGGDGRGKAGNAEVARAVFNGGGASSGGPPAVESALAAAERLGEPPSGLGLARCHTPF